MSYGPDLKNCPSFASLQASDSFQHFRSASYFEAAAAAVSSETGSKSFGPCVSDRPPFRGSSVSTPCTPKKIEIEKYSTLPVSSGAAAVKKTRSASLSSFFRKLRPNFHRSDGKNPWIVIEFAPRSEDADASSGSDNSVELAVEGKARHFTSLKDVSYSSSHAGDCHCALSNNSRTSPPRHVDSEFRSEGSVFFRLSPRRRLENLKHMLKNFSKRRKFPSSVSLHSLNSRICNHQVLESRMKSGGTFSSFGQVGHGRAPSPIFQFCKPVKHDNLKSLKPTSDFGYLYKIPYSRSSNASLSSVLEDSCALKRIQPPNTLSLSAGRAYRDQQGLRHKMASVESIGACSLDLEASAGESFAAAPRDLTASECTLLSGGSPAVRNDDAAAGPPSVEPHRPTQNGECSVAEIKLPSYVSISCAINGYANFSRFCRSRDSSPARQQMPRVFTESRRVSVAKQIRVPLESTRCYTTGVTLLAGADDVAKSANVLAKEVGSDGSKSLVQQRIESLYGKSVGDEVRKCAKHTRVLENSIPSQADGKTHIGSVSPPVFRHLNKDFRRQLQIHIPRVEKSRLADKEQNGTKEAVVSNGTDECDRSMPDRDGHRFLRDVDLRRGEIEAKVRALEEELSVRPDLPEEASGRIRAVCGKANLLVAQKFEQFRGLCWENIEGDPTVPFYTTGSDLAGFWDMVMLQVEDINATFKEIDLMRQNNWKETVCEKRLPASTRPTSRSNPGTPKRSTTARAAEQSRARDEARRQLLAAKKRKGRREREDEEEVAIFVAAPGF